MLNANIVHQALGCGRAVVGVGNVQHCYGGKSTEAGMSLQNCRYAMSVESSQV